MLEENYLALFVALVLLAALIAHFPTRGRVRRWIAQEEGKLRWGSAG